MISSNKTEDQIPFLLPFDAGRHLVSIFKGLNNAKANRSDVRVRHDLMLHAMSNVKPMLIVNAAAAMGGAFVMFSHAERLTISWLFCVLALTIVRAVGLQHFQRRLQKIDPESEGYESLHRATAMFYGLGLVISGLLWNGLLALAITLNNEAQYFIAVEMSALAGGAIGILAPVKLSGRAYISSILVPAGIIFLFSTGETLIMAPLAFVFWVVMLVAHNTNYKALRNSYVLQAEKNTLVDRLTALNRTLEEKVSERTRELETAALHDPLTGLANRRGFHDTLEREIKNAKTSRNPLSVGFIDLDGFKPVNDAFGHATGDMLLTEVGRRLKGTIGRDCFVARLGGDEFGFICAGQADPDKLQSMGNQICALLADSYHLTGVVAEIGASVGISTYPADAETADDLCEKADYALYHAKQARKGTAVIFNEKHQAEIRDLAQMEQKLRRADFESEIYVVFQPIANCLTGELYGFEALARWNSPSLGNVPPGMFIRAAERSGLILNLTRHLVAKALRTAQNWPEHIRISINLSARDIASMDAVRELVEIVKASNVDPRRIDFEITETAFVCDFGQALDALNALHQLGASIALDDFGTGHSSLSHLRLLPLDKLKIDASFVADINSHQPSEDIVRTLIKLCDNMRIGCVVEGIETIDHLRKVREMGASLMQGYHLARPMPETDVSSFILTDFINRNNLLGYFDKPMKALPAPETDQTAKG